MYDVHTMLYMSSLFVFPLYIRRLIKEMYLIVPHVERLEDTRKNLQQTVYDACTVNTMSLIRTSVRISIMSVINPNKTVNQKIPHSLKNLLCFTGKVKNLLMSKALPSFPLRKHTLMFCSEYIIRI